MFNNLFTAKHNIIIYDDYRYRQIAQEFTIKYSHSMEQLLTNQLVSIKREMNVLYDFI